MICKAHKLQFGGGVILGVSMGHKPYVALKCLNSVLMLCKDCAWWLPTPSDKALK